MLVPPSLIKLLQNYLKHRYNKLFLLKLTYLNILICLYHKYFQKIHYWLWKKLWTGQDTFKREVMNSFLLRFKGYKKKEERNRKVWY